jgi:hypothetical protein
MKKIITKPILEEEILASDLPKYPFVGAFPKSYPDKKCFLVMTKYYDNHSYFVMSREGFEHGNGYGVDIDFDYCGTIEKVLGNPALDFVLFGSAKELFKWLSE